MAFDVLSKTGRKFGLIYIRTPHFRSFFAYECRVGRALAWVLHPTCILVKPGFENAIDFNYPASNWQSRPLSFLYI